MTAAQAGLWKRMGDAHSAPEPARTALPAQSDPGPARPAESAAHRAATRILIVEDQPALLRALRINLRARQYDVLTARTGREALAVAASHPPDAVILDLDLPDIDGTEVIVELRRWYHAPIIVLSGRTSPGDKIGAPDVGADDYVTKPLAMAELLARLRAALRRDEAEVGRDQPRQATVGRWLVDLTAHQVRRASAGEEETLRLTPDRMGDPRAPAESSRPACRVGADPHLSLGSRLPAAHQLPVLPHGRLRRKLEDNPARPRHLLTEPGMGYRYQP